MTRRMLGGFAVLAASAGLLTLTGAETVPLDFQVTMLADGLARPKGIDTVHHQAGAGAMDKDFLFIAESNADDIVRVNKFTGDVEYHADTMGFFPVGVGCYGGPFGPYMYVGNAMGGGIVRIDAEGFTEPFALLDKSIAGMDFSKGEYGKFLYAGEWALGNIWRVDRFGNEELFATIPTCETRYMKFAQSDAFGQFLYFSDFVAGEIYRVMPDGTEMLFSTIGVPGLEGFDFGRGYFGEFLYIGSITTGEIYRVAPDGTWDIWASGFEGVADIIFKPEQGQGFVMYIVDGHSKVYRIEKL